MTFKQSHIHLIGNSEENFYVLGKRDKDAFEAIYGQLSMLCARNHILAKAIKIATEFSRRFNSKKGNEQVADLKAYAHGLERKYEDVFFTLLLPEIVASFNKWIPDLLSVIPGCSSLFVWDKINNGAVHTRILDYALSGPFEKEERSILYELPHSHKVLSFGTAGMPLASLSAMNDKGLTMALHYKHGNYFDLEGESIFLLANEMIQSCGDIREALKFIKTKKSISYWGMYLSDKNGEVLSVDICGDQIYQEKFDLKDHDYLYFNNRPLLNKAQYSDFRPYGNLEQCKMRRDTVKKTMQTKNISESKDIMLDTIKLLAKPMARKSKSAKNWKLAPTNLSSIQTCSFHNSLDQAYFIPGPAPKYFLNSYIKLDDIFKKIKITTKENKKKASRYVRGNQYLSEYQSSLDSGDISRAYHKIQMAIEMLEGHPEEIIAKFYFLITQYIYEADKRDLTYLYSEFLELEGLLPDYLDDHRELFILRLGKLIGHKTENQSMKITNPYLKEIYLDEFKLNLVALKGLKKLIFPRIEILDIIYTY